MSSDTLESDIQTGIEETADTAEVADSQPASNEEQTADNTSQSADNSNQSAKSSGESADNSSQSRNGAFGVSSKEKDDKLTELWSSYISGSKDKFFWMFLNKFIEKWEHSLVPSWELLVTSRLSGSLQQGPNLASLPEELLPALNKFLFIGKDEAEQGMTNYNSLDQICRLIKTLTILCLNTDNIPLVGSMEFVTHITQLNTRLLEYLLEMESTFFSQSTPAESNQKLRTSISSTIIESCHFLETMYDPYFRWRAYLCGKQLQERQRIECPISLHSVTIPFLYESFESALVDCFPEVGHEMLTVFGAIISGARHNASKAISPATTKMILKTVRDSKTSQDIHINAIYCSSLSIRILHETPLEERQLDISVLVDQYQQILLSLTSKKEVSLATLVEGISLISRTLQVNNSKELQQIFARRGIITNLMQVIGDCHLGVDQRRTLLPVVITRISLVLQNCDYAQNLMEKEGLYARLFDLVNSMGPPDYNTLHSILAVSTHGEDPTVQGKKIHNIQPIKKLLNWLTVTEYENHEQQVWLMECVHNLCTSRLQNKMLCCQHQLIKDIVETLSYHERLQKTSAEYLLKLIEVLGQHSISAAELKLLIGFLKNQSEEEIREEKPKFPFKSHIIHILSSMAKGSGFEHSRQFFDIQENIEGISVPGILEWPGPIHGFSFFAWLRLDEMKDIPNCRRQLYSFYSNTGSGLEAFFLSNGVLAIATAYKKEFFVTKCDEFPFDDGQWHSLAICQAVGKRPFGQSSLSIYIDGSLRTQSSLKYPSFVEPLTYCQFGAELSRANLPVVTSPTSGSSSLKENIKDTLKSTGVFSLPTYLKKQNNTDPKVQWTMLGMEDVMWGRSIALKGQLGLMYVFQDCLSQSQTRLLHSLGANQTFPHKPLAEEETTDYTDMLTKLVFNFSSRVCYNMVLTNLVPNPVVNLDGHTLCSPYTTQDVKDVINCLGGIQILFPILEICLYDISLDTSYLNISNTSKESSKSSSGEPEPEWEMLPSSSFSDWNLEKNPVSGFMTLLKNMTTNHQVNQEQLMRGAGVAIMGSLLQKVDISLIDVNVLMAAQLFTEILTVTKQSKLLYQFYHSILLDFRIWSRSEFHMQIGHIQYISTLIMSDRKYFRKKFGIQYFLDVIRQHYSDNSVKVLSTEDCITIRGALLGLVKFFIQKEVNAREVNALINFMFINRKSSLLSEVLDTLLLHIESKFVKDQLFLLMYEVKSLDLIYCVLLENTDEQTRMKIYKLLSDFLRTPRISSRHKGRMHLQQVGYLGFLYMRSSKEPPFSLQEVVNLTDNMLLFDHNSSYQGILGLCQHLQMSSIDIKLELVRKLLTIVYSHSQASTQISKQTGWEGCVSRLLVKEIVQPELDSVVSVEDVISLNEEDDEDSLVEESSPTHYINKVTGTAQQYLPGPAGTAVKMVGDSVGAVAEEAGKMFAGTSKMVKSNIQHATGKVSATAQITQNLVNDKVQHAHERVSRTVNKANTLIDSVSDKPNKKREKHVSETKSDNPQFLQNYAYEYADLDNLSLDSEDVSKSRETICSSPTRTHDSISEDDISFDMDHFGAELEGLQRKPRGDTEEAREDELVQLLTTILFSVLWRGTLSRHKKDQGSYLLQTYGQIVASINLLALNNKLYTSHVVLKRKLAEMCVEAILSDSKEKKHFGDNVAIAKSIMEIVYDLVILDEHEDFSKKVSEELLDGILSVLDNFSVFQPDSPEGEKDEVAKMALNVLIECAGNTKDLEFCAIASAKLHNLVQTRSETSTDEIGFMIFKINIVMQESLSEENSDHYAFMVPIMKVLLDKAKASFQLTTQLPSLNLRLTGCEFFEMFKEYCKSEEWQYFISRKVKILHDDYCMGTIITLSDRFNEFWGNCYEEAKTSVHRRNREIGESKLQFIGQYQEPFRTRLKEERIRFQNVLTQQKSNNFFVQKRWRILQRLFIGPRGTWGRPGDCLTDHWKLAPNENMQRMRMKLVPSLTFDLHTEASAARDNIKKPAGNPEQDNLLDLKISKEAVVCIPEEDQADLTEDDLKQIAKEQMDSTQESDDEVELEKFIMSEDCELVTMMTVIKGRFELTSSYIYFFDSTPIKDNAERYDNRWSLTSLREVYLRRFNLRKSAIEVFMFDQTNFFLNFSSFKKRNKVYLKIWGLKLPNLLIHGTRSPRDLLRASGLTQKWVNREISNFEYLMHLNTIAGRSYNDLSQYPVFPWILSDYDSTCLDLGSTATFRDLSKPMGVQNSSHLEEIKQKYENFEDPSGMVAKFHYGTHYSNSAMVLHYLVRVEPFTTLHINLQSGRFDVADRQFHSIPQAWRGLINNINDVKELIPEFYYFPDFLLNLNCFDLGKLQGKKEVVSDVILPSWAVNVDDFIRQHRSALESEYVSAHLHEWIDLIFGYKQKGQPAVDAMNVFYYCCYEGAVNLDAITDPAEREALEGMIQNFGQVPCQLLKEPHPTRISYTEFCSRLNKSDHRRPDLLKYPTKWRPYFVEMAEDRNPLLYLDHPLKQAKYYLGYGNVDSLVSISSDCSIGVHYWLPYDKNTPNYFYLEKDATITTKASKKLPGPFSKSLKFKPEMFAVTPDAKFVVYGGSWDFSLRVYSLVRWKEAGSSIRHTGILSCVGMDAGGLHCISGSQDSTAIVWELNAGQDACALKIVQTLYGHDGPVCAVVLSMCLDLAVTGSKDGTVNVHSIKDGEYMRTLRHPGVDISFTVDLLTLSYQGHVIFTGHTPDNHSMHVYTLNGRHIASSHITHRITGLLSSGDYVLSGDENGDLNLLDLYTLRVGKSLPVQLPIQTVTLTRGNTHILVPLRDGKLIVVGLSGLPDTMSS